ncbi:MAG: class IV adenylate cyclase [Pyrinomonadaceae bacterium]
MNETEMAIEIEKKYRMTAENRELILSNLKEFGAEFVGEDFEENIIHRGGVLDAERAVLRIRKIGQQTILTYKKPIENQTGIKHQLEYETSVENAGELEKIIECLGFDRVLVYEKRRQIWKFRNVEIVLDELPFGSFLEIEGSMMAIAETEMLLDLEDFTVEYETYPRLTQKYGNVNGNLIEARF